MSKSVLIAYASDSGNTKEVAELVQSELGRLGVRVSLFNISPSMTNIPDVKALDLLIVGSFTWDSGSVPDEVKDFVIDVGFKPDNVAVFGTGETQFGEYNYCLAAHKLARFYESPYDVLEIEQSPRGSQESKVINWCEMLVKRPVNEV